MYIDTLIFCRWKKVRPEVNLQEFYDSPIALFGSLIPKEKVNLAVQNPVCIKRPLLTCWSGFRTSSTWSNKRQSPLAKPRSRGSIKQYMFEQCFSRGGSCTRLRWTTTNKFILPVQVYNLLITTCTCSSWSEQSSILLAYWRLQAWRNY